jgi:hypothetical protein
LRVVLREAAKAPYRTPGRIRLGAMERGADRRPAKRHERGNRARQSHPPRPTRLPRTLTGLERAGRRKTKLERDTDLTDAEQDGADFEDDRQDQDRDRRPGQCRQPDDDVGERDEAEYEPLVAVTEERARNLDRTARNERDPDHDRQRVKRDSRPGRRKHPRGDPANPNHPREPRSRGREADRSSPTPVRINAAATSQCSTESESNVLAMSTPPKTTQAIPTKSTNHQGRRATTVFNPVNIAALSSSDAARYAPPVRPIPSCRCSPGQLDRTAKMEA